MVSSTKKLIEQQALDALSGTVCINVLIWVRRWRMESYYATAFGNGNPMTNIGVVFVQNFPKELLNKAAWYLADIYIPSNHTYTCTVYLETIKKYKYHGQIQKID